MPPLVIILVLVSATMHAGWNLLARRGRSEELFFSRMLSSVAVLGLLPMIVSEASARSLTPKAWACAVGSGVLCAVYCLYLARAYGSSDFTVVYPVARSLPVLLIGVGDSLRGRNLTEFGWLGMLIVMSGCFLAPLHTVREVTLSRYANKATLWMLLAAGGTVGYTLLDKMASEVVKQGPGTAARYEYVFIAVSSIVYELLRRRKKQQKRAADSIGWMVPTLGGCLNFAAYWLVLWAYQMTERASYIYAFRQFSILIGVGLGFAIYKERGLRVRLSAALLILVGLVIIGVWGH